MYDVACLQHEIASRYDDLIPALHDRYEYAAAVLGAEPVKAQTAERRALLHDMLDHLGPALGKGVDLRSAGEAQYARDVRRRGLLRVEHERKTQLVLEEDHLAEILHGAHARDGVLDAQLFAGEAAEHIHRVVVRHGYEQVGVADLRLAEHAVIRAVAEQGHDVHTV